MWSTDLLQHTTHVYMFICFCNNALFMATAVSSTSLRTLRFKFNNLSPFSPPNGFLRLRRTSRCGGARWSMFVKAPPTLKNGVLTFNGRDTLLGVPENVLLTPCSDSAAFLGALSSQTSSRHVFKLGLIQGARLLSLFRFKIWWMIPRVGSSGKDIPAETQMLLLEAREEPNFAEPDGNTAYVLFLPILDGEFRSSLQGNIANELEVCVETGDSAGDSAKNGPGSSRAVLVNYGSNPFELIKESMKILQKYSGTFALRETKQLPGMLDWFGWCTWDAFYQDVNPQGIRDVLKSLSEGGTPARFLIIDDGWQDTANEFQKEGEPLREGTQFGARLMSIRENEKFRKASNYDSSGKPHSLKDFVSDIKETFGLKYVYVWHALMGYWGGLHPNCPGTQKYNPTVKFPQLSIGNLAHRRDIAMERMEEYGVGMVDPERIFEFYDDLHSYLVSQDVDGVKVDVQNILETVATGSGGRVSLARIFHQSLEKSISNNFRDNSIICCMAQSTDSLYSANTSAITRASDDYYPNNPTTQTLHIAAVAFNSLLFGEVFVPDWDMFYSLHDSAEFHAIARAVGGCGVYVSDKPGKHDFEILKRLVLPDGAVLRAKYPGRPSRDCLFVDPVMDGKSLMKIWNHNKFCGVLAVFNCQGAGAWPGLENTVQRDGLELTGDISPADIEYLTEIDLQPQTGDFAVFSFKSGFLFRVSLYGKLTVKLKTLQCDVFTVSPIKSYNEDLQFAPLGLINMYNSGGAIDAVEAINDPSFNKIRIRGRGEGVFGAYMSSEPKVCYVNMEEVHFNFSSEEHFLTVIVPIGTTSWEIDINH
ncbi:probable galactinol--sucrose galactosyltransferase 2 [Salvia splendens]|uniref:probable galactinol--sucrose galactosyltransferase 2 n=1 Tax=Salvia splendens TaxID=180675 RepID=UPI001C27D988|nr:probable galactinol--sucrose galactosyltransferase 2 [Salvia splendens]